MRLRLLSSWVLLSASLGCGNPVSVTQDRFTIQATGQEVVLRNAAGRPTFYFVVERESAALVNFATCVDPSGCRNVGPEATVRVPYSEILGYKAGTKEVIVYWWRAVGSHPDSVRSVVTEL